MQGWAMEVLTLTDYLHSDEIVDFKSPKAEDIRRLCRSIQQKSSNRTAFVKAAYEYVRDQINHSADIQGKTVTCRSWEVLAAGEGICFAKSHLLAALLRCGGIPAGFCYQKLILDDQEAVYLILHGMNAVYLEDHSRWIRLDARGNKPGVQAEFSLEGEKLAFPVRKDRGESDIPAIYARPDTAVIQTMTAHATLDALWQNLPVQLNGFQKL